MYKSACFYHQKAAKVRQREELAVSVVMFVKNRKYDEKKVAGGRW